MPIWTAPVTPDALNLHLRDTMCDHIGIEITEVGDDYLKATMPVDRRTRQHMGIVHGGASVVLAETIGSIGANLCAQPGYVCVGQEVNANHIRGGKPPYLVGIARPLHLGNSSHVWEIKIYDAREEKLVCASRLTMAVLKSET